MPNRCAALLADHVTVRPTLLYVLSAFVAAGCTSVSTSAAPPVDASLDDTLTLALGASSATSDGGLRVTFVELVSESRCPTDVVCVWQGDAAVKLSGTTKAGLIESTIHTGVDPRTMEVGGYQLRLLDVRPYPRQAPSTQAKSVVVRITRGVATTNERSP